MQRAYKHALFICGSTKCPCMPYKKITPIEIIPRIANTHNPLHVLPESTTNLFFTSHIAISLEVLHAWSFIYVENGREWMGEKCMTKTVIEGDEGNGFERHWKVGMKMGSGCEWYMS